MSGTASRDPRPIIYLALDQICVIVYIYVLRSVIPNRLPTAMLHLWTIPICMEIMAIGCGAIFCEASWKRTGRWIAIAGGSLLLLSTIVLIIRVLVSAAFLAGVYGAFGKAAATFALIAIAIVIEAVVLLPIVQIKYLMSRAGQRAFA